MKIPYPPNSLRTDIAVNYYYEIWLYWVAPTVVAGSPVISYELTWDNGLGTTDIVLNSAITSLYYRISS